MVLATVMRCDLRLEPRARFETEDVKHIHHHTYGGVCAQRVLAGMCRHRSKQHRPPEVRNRVPGITSCVVVTRVLL